MSDLYLQSEVRALKAVSDIGPDASASLVQRTYIQQYEARVEWGVPSRKQLQSWHPLTGKPFWAEVLRAVHGGFPEGGNGGMHA